MDKHINEIQIIFKTEKAPKNISNLLKHKLIDLKSIMNQ